MAMALALSRDDACWNTTGAYGDGRCAQLQEFAHCRNCPVFSAAALRLLDRPHPPEYRRESTGHFAAEKKLREPRNTSVILFRIQDEWLALPTQAFQEVAEHRPIHTLPHQRHGVVLGLANVRGELLIAVSLGEFLGLAHIPPRSALRATYHRLLVSSWEAQRLAFPIDEVHGPHRFFPQELTPAPATAHCFSHALLPWRGRSVGCLDPELLFPALNRSLA